jgi:hypothetical protein
MMGTRGLIMSDRPVNSGFPPPTEDALARAKRDPILLARLRKSIEALQRGERPIPATELMAEVRRTIAGD